MNYVNGLLQKLIYKNNQVCSLCFEEISGNEVIHMADEVALGENSSENNIQVSEIFVYIFNDEVLKIVSGFDEFCADCVTAAANSYRFLKETEERMKNVSNTLEHLNSCFDTVPQDLEDSTTLFVSLDPELGVTNQYYVNDLLVCNRMEALQRYKSIVNMKVLKSEKIKEENEIEKKHVEKVDQTQLKSKSKLDMSSKEEIDKFICKECNKVFTSKVNLRSHFYRTHTQKKYKCDKCPKRFESQASLDNHIAGIHTNHICSECGKTFDNRNALKMHEQRHYTKLICQDCGRVYRNQNTFKKHLENNICQNQYRHSPADAKYTCDYCQKKYTQKISLRVHIQYEHLGYMHLKCKWCDKKFSCKSRLNAHAVKHTRERNFVCNICNGKFVTKESLLYHTRIHTGEKPYQCPHCESRFLSASRRSAHVKSYHMDPTVECDICHNKFRSQHYLYKHKKIHEKAIENKSKGSQSSNKTLVDIESAHGDKIFMKIEAAHVTDEGIKTYMNPSLVHNEVKGLQFYYEADKEVNLTPHNVIQVNAIKTENSIENNLHIMYQEHETDTNQNTQIGPKAYLEVEFDHEEYVLKVSENVEV